jgi:hypothetical protein
MTCSGTLPDVLQAVMDILEGATTLSTVDEISADLTAYVTGEIWIVVNEAPGSVIVEGRLWRCLFDLNCFAPTFGEARDTCVAAQQALVAALNTATTDLIITKVVTETPPYLMTDYVSNVPRYVCTMAVYCRPV